jgi:hypothetical protein
MGERNENDRFFLDPETYLVDWIAREAHLPSHIVLYDKVEAAVQGVLTSNGFSKVWLPIMRPNKLQSN